MLGDKKFGRRPAAPDTRRDGQCSGVGDGPVVPSGNGNGGRSIRIPNGQDVCGSSFGSDIDGIGAGIGDAADINSFSIGIVADIYGTCLSCSTDIKLVIDIPGNPQCSSRTLLVSHYQIITHENVTFFTTATSNRLICGVQNNIGGSRGYIIEISAAGITKGKTQSVDGIRVDEIAAVHRQKRRAACADGTCIAGRSGRTLNASGSG